MPGCFEFVLQDHTPEHANIQRKFLKSIETVAKRCSIKKVFLEISQNSPENICARVSILLKQKRFWRRYFPVKFAKILRTPFLTEHLQWLLLRAPNLGVSWHPNVSYSLYYPEHLKFLGKSTPQNTLFTEQLPVAAFKCQLLFYKREKQKQFFMPPLS